MITLDWTIFLQFANFVVLMFILNILLYRPLRRIFEERRQTVAGGHEKARELTARIEEKMAVYQQQLQDARQQGAREKAELRRQAASEEAKILGVAHQAAGEHVQQIKTQVQAEAEAARTTLKKETDDLAGMIAAKVLGRTL